MLCHILVLPCVTLACLVQHVECFQLQLIALFQQVLEIVGICDFCDFCDFALVFTARWAQRQAKDSESISERVHLRGAESLALLASPVILRVQGLLDASGEDDNCLKLVHIP